jgi:hypothetical protein
VVSLPRHCRSSITTGAVVVDCANDTRGASQINATATIDIRFDLFTLMIARF